MISIEILNHKKTLIKTKLEALGYAFVVGGGISTADYQTRKKFLEEELQILEGDDCE